MEPSTEVIRLTADPSGIPTHHPLSGLIRSYPNGDHDPTQRRNSITFTTVPKEILFLQRGVKKLLASMTADPENTFDAIHVCIPDRPLRSQDVYPSTRELQAMFTDPRIIIHRLPDYGPMTRYLGPLAFEQHPDSSILLFDVDTRGLVYDLTSSVNVGGNTRDLVHLVYASRHLDESAMWCNQGENFLMNELQQVSENWDLFPEVQEGNLSWNRVHFCRGVGGLLFKPKHFVDFWYNQSDYHESCFWDDDRWVSYQMERQGFPLKVVHNPTHSPSADITASHRRLGSLSSVNKELNSAETCPVAWLTKHPDAYPTARVKSETPPGGKDAALRRKNETDASIKHYGPNSTQQPQSSNSTQQSTHLGLPLNRSPQPHVPTSTQQRKHSDPARPSILISKQQPNPSKSTKQPFPSDKPPKQQPNPSKSTKHPFPSDKPPKQQPNPSKSTKHPFPSDKPPTSPTVPRPHFIRRNRMQQTSQPA